MYWYLRRTFFSKTGPKPPKRKKRKRKNVRICSPSLALKYKRYCCWSFQVPICVPAPYDPSVWPLTPVMPVLNSDPQSCQSSWGVWLSHTPDWWWPVTNLISQSHRGRSKSDTVAFLILLLLHSFNTKMWGMALRDAAHLLTTKGIASKHFLIQTPEL